MIIVQKSSSDAETKRKNNNYQFREDMFVSKTNFGDAYCHVRDKYIRNHFIDTKEMVKTTPLNLGAEIETDAR